MKDPSISDRGILVGSGAQFDVFEDKINPEANLVYKRVKMFEVSSNTLPQDFDSRARLRTVQLEIASLCDPVRRLNRNVVDIVAWGYDYPTNDVNVRLPVLLMEKALCSLEEVLCGNYIHSTALRASDIHHQLSLDMACGLQGVHESGLAHGDLKPSNVLIFKQDNGHVPFIAKLSDFGLCIVLDDRINSYRAYRGTPNWLPPETTMEYCDNARFLAQNLTKSDAYAFGLVVMSVFLYHGNTISGASKQSAECISDQCVSDIKELGLSKALCHKLESLATSLLNSRPESRPEVHPDLLCCDVGSYRHWLVRRTFVYLHSDWNARVSSREDTSHFDCTAFGFKNPRRFTDYEYYASLDPAVFSQLESQYTEPALRDSLNFNHQILFGMAITSIFRSKPGYRARSVEYALAAARLSSTPAQAIITRLLQAVPEFSAKPSRKETEDWLYNGAKTGSLIAMEDLRKLNLAAAAQAREEFVQNGGYNENMSPVQYKEISRLAAGPAYHYPTELLELRVDNMGNRPLHYAAAFGNDALLEMLLIWGAKVDAINDVGETALYKACLAGSMVGVSTLAHFHADASISSPAHGTTCLHWLFNFNDDDQECVGRTLVARGAKPQACAKQIRPQNYPAPIKWLHFPFHWPAGTPLHWATFARSPSACDALLAVGLDIDIPDIPGYPRSQSSLAMAAHRGDSLMVQHLLSRKADPNRLDEKGSSPAHMMAVSSFRNCWLFDMRLSLRWWVYHGSWKNHCSELGKCVEQILSAGGKIDVQSRQVTSGTFHTPLLDAADEGDGGAILALLEGGCSAASVSKYSLDTPLHIWIQHDSRSLPYEQSFKSAVEELLTKVSDVGAKNSLGQTVMHQSVYAPLEGDFQYLTTRFHSISPRLLNAVDKLGYPPLYTALERPASIDNQYSARSRSEWLLDMDADMSVKDVYNRDFVLNVCRTSHLPDQDCLFLIQKRLRQMQPIDQRIYVQSLKSKRDLHSPLMAACMMSLPRVVKLLISLMDEINGLSTEKLTAFDIALDTAQTTRQRHLTMWSVRSKLKWNQHQSRFQFIGHGLNLESLQNHAVFLEDEMAKAALFQRTFTESDNCEDSFSRRGIAGKLTRTKLHASQAERTCWKVRTFVVTLEIRCLIPFPTVEKYFGRMEIVKALKEAGAVQARQICEDPGEYDSLGPREWDEISQQEDGNDIDPGFAKGQPFWTGHWDLLYEIREN